MSHGSKDAVGGHKGSGIVYDDGFYSHSQEGRRWAKRFNRREARREARKIIAAAVIEHEEELAERAAFDWGMEEDWAYDLGIYQYEDEDEYEHEPDYFDEPNYYEEYYAYDYFDY